MLRSTHEAVVKELQNEIAQLQGLLTLGTNRNVSPVSAEEISAAKSKLEDIDQLIDLLGNWRPIRMADHRRKSQQMDELIKQRRLIIAQPDHALLLTEAASAK
ncbi:MAG: hypothetical protein ABL984_13975 [Pyrinomonadaceae bacterium]